MAGRDMEWSSRRGQACGGAIPGGSSAEETGQGRWSEHQLGSGYPLGKDTEGGGSPWRRGDGGVVARGRRVAVRQRREPYGGRRWPGCVLPARRSRGRGEAPIDLKKWRTGWASTWKGTTVEGNNGGGLHHREADIWQCLRLMGWLGALGWCKLAQEEEMVRGGRGCLIVKAEGGRANGGGGSGTGDGWRGWGLTWCWTVRVHMWLAARLRPRRDCDCSTSNTRQGSEEEGD
jgi:hypothetical protein